MRHAIDDGIFTVTEARELDGFFEAMTIDDNMHVAKAGRSFLLSGAARKALAAESISRRRIAAFDNRAKNAELSGGNRRTWWWARPWPQAPSSSSTSRRAVPT